MSWNCCKWVAMHEAAMKTRHGKPLWMGQLSNLSYRALQNVSALFLVPCLSPPTVLSPDTVSLTALPRIELFTSLHDLIASYPSPPILRERLFDHLLDELRTTLPDEPLGIKLSATRALKPEVAGEDLVEALKDANQIMLASIKNEGKNRESYLRAYADFVEQWCRAAIDANLVCLCIWTDPMAN